MERPTRVATTATRMERSKAVNTPRTQLAGIRYRRGGSPLTCGVAGRGEFSRGSSLPHPPKVWARIYSIPSRCYRCRFPCCDVCRIGFPIIAFVHSPPPSSNV